MLPPTSALACYFPDLIFRRCDAGPPPSLQPEATRFEGVVLFADISGFTRLTERLARQGPAGAEQLTGLLNGYFERLVTLIRDHGGDVVKFAGDALLAVWTAVAKGEDVAALVRRVAQCGLDVQAALRDYQAAEGVTLSLKVGVGVGELTALHLGGVRDRWELLLTGPPLGQIGVAEHQAQSGEVVLSAEAWTLVAALGRGTPRAHGCVRLETLTQLLPPLPALSPPLKEETAAALCAYVPGAVRARLAAGQMAWLAELRRVTVLFLNLPGLNCTAADALSSAQGVVQALQGALYRYEGSLNKLSVDDKGVTLVAALGLPPLTHEDDAVRGVLAAQAMQAELRALGMTGAAGVTTGRVYCGEIGGACRREYTLIGDTVNLAARLMQAAPGDGLLCDAATYQAARSRLQFEALAPLTVKGKAEPVPVYRPLGRAAPSEAPGSLFGRAAERAVLAEALTALEARAGGLVVIVGEAGIGKSLLLAALGDRARGRGMTVLAGAGDAVEKMTPYYAWRPVFEHLLGVDEGTDAPARRAQVLEALRPVPALLRLAPLLSSVLALDLSDDELTSQMTGQVRADNTHELLLGLLQEAVQRVPTVLIIEDAHWLDSASWTLAAMVALRVQSLLLVVATRPLSEPVPPQTQRLFETPGARQVQLEGLPPEETQALVCQRLGVNSLPETVAALIRQKAQGNPFFSEELACALRDTGLIRIEGGRCQITPGAALSAAAFPDSVQGVITSRIDRLTPPQQLALKVASVIGRVFPFRVLRDVFPLEAEKDQLAGHLTTLAQLGLTPLETPEPNLAYLFKHVLTQEAAYGLLLYAHRRDMHRVVAEWYERTFGEELAPHYPLLAHHWGKAEVSAKAIDYLEKVGEQALRAGAYQEVLLSLQEAVQRDGTASPQGGACSSDLRRARWHRQIGYACMGLGRVEEGRRNLEQAVALLGYPVPRSRWRFALGLMRQALVQVLHRVLPGRVEGQRAAEGSPVLEGASAYCGLVSLYYFASEPWRTVDASLRALNICERAGLSPELARSYAAVEVAATLIPWHAVAASYGRRALRAARAVGDRPALAWVLLCHSFYSALAGNWEDVRNDCEEGIEIADGIGDRRRGVELTLVLSCTLQCQADFQGGIQFAQDAHARASRSGDVQGQVLGLLREVENLLPLGQLDRALTLLDRVTPFLAHKLGVTLDFWAAAMRAVVHLRQGEARLAQTIAEAAGKLVAGLRPTFWGCLEGYAGIAEVCLSRWEAANAAAESRLLKEAAGRACAALWKYAGVFRICRPRAWRWQGLSDWLSGRTARAHRAWRRSLDAAERLRMPLERGLALYEIGRHLPAAEPTRQTHLRDSCEVFSRLGAVHHLHCARTALGE